MIHIRKSHERGHADRGWLDSYHTFSFAEYHDPLQMGFRSLRVINEDRVEAGMGFPTHSHRDMEIFSYVLEGSLQHKDNLGNARTLHPGEIQLMAAGTGVMHSEFNASHADTAHFLQIWITPGERGLPPSYTEWHPRAEHTNAAKVLVISPDGRDGSALIHQDVDVWRLKLPAGEPVTHELKPGRGAWLQVVQGELSLNGETLNAGDGASTEFSGKLEMVAGGDAEALLFDLG